MNPLDLRLYELLGDKTLSFGCVVENKNDVLLRVFKAKPDAVMFMLYGDDTKECISRRDSDTGKFPELKIIGHEPTIADLHRMVCRDSAQFYQNRRTISISVKHKERDGILTDFMVCDITYDASLALLQQSEETKQAIISLIESHG